MSFFNDAQRDGLLTGRYICSECGGLMEFEDEWEDTLVCPACGHSVDLEHYGMGRTSLRPWFMGNKMQFEAVACRLFLHYSYTLAQKASNYGIFCFYYRIKTANG